MQKKKNPVISIMNSIAQNNYAHNYVYVKYALTSIS